MNKNELLFEIIDNKVYNLRQLTFLYLLKNKII